MNATIKAFRALCWKQYRESRGLVLLAIFVTFAWVALHFWNKYLIDHSISIQFLGQSLNKIIFLGGLISVLLIFTPVFSVESERKILGYLGVKPISPERMGLITGIAACGFALIPLISVILVYSVILFLHNSPDRAYFLYHRTLQDYYALQYYFLILSGTGCFLLFISACTSNRIRSFGIALLGLCAEGFVFIVVNDFYCNFYYNSKAVYFNNRLEYFFSKLLYAFDVNPFFYTLVLCFLFITLALMAFRIRMLHSLHLRRIYTIVLSATIAAALIILLINVPDRTICSVSVSPDTLGPETRQFINSLAAQSYKLYGIKQSKTILSENIIISTVKTRGYRSVINPGDPIQVKIEKMEGVSQSRILFDRSVLDCFPVDTMTEVDLDTTNVSFYRLEDWSVIASENSGLLHGILRDPSKEIGKDVDGMPLYQDRPEESGLFLLGHFTLGENRQFTLLKRCVFHFAGFNGKENITLECIKPGLFSRDDLNRFTKPLSDVLFKENTKEPGKLILNLNQSPYRISSYRTLTRIGHALDQPSGLDHTQGNRLYYLMIEENAEHHFFPVLSCYDLSDPEILKVYCEIPDLDIDSQGQFADSMISNVPVSNDYAIDNNRLVCLLSNSSSDQIVVYDISQPDNIHKIARRTYSRWRNWGNWELGSGKIRLDDGKLLVQSPLGVYLYALQADYSLKRIARKTGRFGNSEMNNAKITDGYLSVLWNDRFSQYTIGESPHNEPSSDRIRSLQLKHGWLPVEE